MSIRSEIDRINALKFEAFAAVRSKGGNFYPDEKKTMEHLVDAIYEIPAASELIVEEGTSGNWYYRKWANGTFEAWGNFEDLLLKDGYCKTPALPFGITGTTPVVNITWQYGSSDNRSVKNTIPTYGGVQNRQLIIYDRTYDGKPGTGYRACSVYCRGEYVV